MSFFDKVKNMFTEEVEDEVKVEKIQKEVTHVPIESPNVDNYVEDDDEIIERFKENISEPPKTIFFDDDDFDDLKLTEPVKEEKKEEDFFEKPTIYRERNKSELYEEKKEEVKFKPTPIISPVYGVLDKNYHKEDIVSRDEVIVQKEADEIDSIRNKAYGTLEDELENTLFGQNSILFKSDESEIINDADDLLNDLTDDISKELDELLNKKSKRIEEIEENNERMLEEDKINNISLEDDDLLGFIDSTLYNKGEDE